jgi:hypothetical protein
MVFLDRFDVRHPHDVAAPSGALDGRFSSGGTASVADLGLGSVVLDTTSAVPVWLRGAVATGSGLAFRVEAEHRYLAVSPAAVLRPEVRKPQPSTLKDRRNAADYLLVAPRAFLDVAEPLLELRREQGLRARGVSIEEIVQQFGHGEAHAQAVKDFLAYAYQRWQRPSPRYVLLLGDATYDPKDFLGTGVRDRVPAPMVRTPYLWTASDPAYAQLNGDDVLPDLAIGRLPAATTDEARVMVEKVLDYERGAHDLAGTAVFVADNGDEAGPFEDDADDAASVVSGRAVEKLYLGTLGGATRSRIQEALDASPSLVSYVGHGGIAVWASENVWNNLDVDALSLHGPDRPLPLLFTLNCLNGYFHFPSLNSLAEQFVKAEGKGAVAAFSPSGLSVSGPAHVYHKALLAEIASGRHARLGDAVMAAQASYAATGAFPELLAIYHLFGDPATRIR